MAKKYKLTFEMIVESDAYVNYLLQIAFQDGLNGKSYLDGKTHEVKCNKEFFGKMKAEVIEEKGQTGG